MHWLLDIFVGHKAAPDERHHESNLAWGPYSIAASLVVSVVAAMKQDLRVLFFVAWPFFALGTWKTCRQIPYSRLGRWTAGLLSLGFAVGLWVLSEWLKPKSRSASTDVQDVRLEFTQPLDPQISVRNAGPGLVREPRYNITLADLDKARWDGKGILPVLKTNRPSFSPSDWLRPGQGFGGYAMFDSTNKPPENSRLFGWATCTCPECITERTYFVFVVFEKSGWYYEIPQGRGINRQFFNSLFGKSAKEQQSSLDTAIPQNERVQFSP